MTNEGDPRKKIDIHVSVTVGSESKLSSDDSSSSEAVRRNNVELNQDAAYREVSVTKEERDNSNFLAELEDRRERSEDAGWRD